MRPCTERGGRFAAGMYTEGEGEIRGEGAQTMTGKVRGGAVDRLKPEPLDRAAYATRE